MSLFTGSAGPHYHFNDQNLAIGAAFWSRLVERYLDPDA
jgi:hippurate hydrolase